jgi:hypothetical protein
MKEVKKFATFEAMKTHPSESNLNALSLKKHKDFEKFIEEVRTIKNTKEAKQF